MSEGVYEDWGRKVISYSSLLVSFNYYFTNLGIMEIICKNNGENRFLYPSIPFSYCIAYSELTWMKK